MEPDLEALDSHLVHLTSDIAGATGFVFIYWDGSELRVASGGHNAKERLAARNLQLQLMPHIDEWEKRERP